VPREPEARRRFLKQIGLGAAVAWTAPTIVSVVAASAATVASIPAFVAVGITGALGWVSIDNGFNWALAVTPPNGTGRAAAAPRLLP
jgi:hypothetical protein